MKKFIKNVIIGVVLYWILATIANLVIVVINIIKRKKYIESDQFEKDLNDMINKMYSDTEGESLED